MCLVAWGNFIFCSTRSMSKATFTSNCCEDASFVPTAALVYAMGLLELLFVIRSAGAVNS